MITIDRLAHKGLSWKKKVALALSQGSTVALTNIRYESDYDHCKAIGKKHKAKLSVHLDYTVCCFSMTGKKYAGQFPSPSSPSRS